MITGVIFVIVIVLLILLLLAVSFLSGYLYSKATTKGCAQREPPKMSELEKVKLKKEQREYENFMSYNGDEQS